MTSIKQSPGPVCFFLAAVMALTFAGVSRGAEPGEKSTPFTVIMLPDTQMYSLNYPETFLQQTKWIKEKKAELNIVAMVHVGDITHRNTEIEWKAADLAISALDDLVPSFLTVGNHDLGELGRAKTRDTLFNKYFGPGRFEGKSWYGGHFGEGNENAFYFFNAGGMDFMVLCLEFGPRDEVLEWARKVVSEHPNHRTIVVTHNYMNWDDTRVGEGDKFNPHDYGCGGNDGEEMWEKFISKHKNIFLVLSGHIVYDGTGRRTDTGDNGNQVHQVLANYQMLENGGNGWLRIITFDPAKNRISFTTYSPSLKQHSRGTHNSWENNFVLDYQMQPTPPETAEKKSAATK